MLVARPDFSGVVPSQVDIFAYESGHFCMRIANPTGVHVGKFACHRNDFDTLADEFFRFAPRDDFLRIDLGHGTVPAYVRLWWLDVQYLNLTRNTDTMGCTRDYVVSIQTKYGYGSWKFAGEAHVDATKKMAEVVAYLNR